ADGMKTGFICSSGFNLVASATHDNKRLIAVVLGAPSAAVRAERAVQLLEKGFGANILSWLTPSLGTVEGLSASAAAPPDLREQNRQVREKKPRRRAPPPRPAATCPSADGMSVDAAKSSARRGPVAPIPLTVLTGFLGAGKTSLLNRLLKDPALADTAVLINEF